MLNALRASTGAKVGFVLSTICAALVAGGVCYLLSILGSGIAAADLTTVVFCMFGLAWLILPLVVFGLDSTLDPATLALYPLRTRPLAVGLLAASATGAWPAATLIGLLGVTIGLARGVLGVLIALLAVLLQVLFCITLARFVTTGLAGMLRSRRGKDLAVLLIIPIFGGVRGLHPDRAEAGLRGRADRLELRGRGPVAAVDTAGPGRARDLGRLHGAPRDRVAAPGAAGRHHRRARRGVDPVPAAAPW